MVVNDGSKDNTAGVAKQYYEKYPQTFRLVSLRKNRGKGAAMKVGVEVARGKYILMVRGCCPMARSSLTTTILLGRCRWSNRNRRCGETYGADAVIREEIQR